MAGETKDGASTVRALVRGTRTALYVQLLVAVLALGAIVFALVTLQRVRGEVTQAEAARDTAVQELGDAQKLREALVSSTQTLLQGRDALSEGRFEPAVLLLQESVAQYDGDATAWSLLAQALHGLQRNAEAVPAMRRAIGIDSSRFGDHARLATYLCLSGDDAGARQAVEAAPEGFAAALRQDADLADVRGEYARACTIVVGLDQAGAGPSAPGTTTGAPVADADPYKVRIIYVHIREESDRPDAERLRARLRAAGYRVPGIQLVAAPRGYGANLRYYYEPQAQEAAAITGIVAEALRADGITGWSGWSPRNVSLASGYENLPRDRVEVWLPER